MCSQDWEPLVWCTQLCNSSITETRNHIASSRASQKSKEAPRLFKKWRNIRPMFITKCYKDIFLEVWKGEIVSRSVIPGSLQTHGLYTARLLCPWDSPGKNTGVGCHFLSKRIILTQGSNLGLLHCRQILYGLNHPTFKHLTFIKSTVWCNYTFNHSASYR